MILWDYIKNKMQNNPNQVVCENNAKITYEELIVFAEYFSKKIKGEKACAILCDSEMATAMGLLACFAAGVTAVPLSIKYGFNYCEKIIKKISPTGIITNMSGSLEVKKIENSYYQEPGIHPALIMCTSGTTGEPKGAMLTEENILVNAKDIVEYLDISKEDRILISRPIYHCAVLTGEFLVSLITGAMIRFYSGKFNPKTLLDIIKDHEITVFCGTPTILRLMARFNDKKDNLTLKTISISGECLDKETGEKILDAFPGTYIYHVYGLTEAGPRVSYLPPALFPKYMDCVGKPLNSVKIKIIKADGEIADKGEEGILFVCGDSIMSGYYNDSELTSKVIQNGWLNTGDIAVINSEGLLKIKGRNDDLIIKGGINVYPQEIEGTLKKDKRVKEVLVYGIDNPYSGVQIGMKIAGDFSNISEVKGLCADLLSEFQIPNQIILLEELPKSATGKIIRR